MPLQAELAGQVFYDWSMVLAKLSILALLARVFTLHWMWFKVGVYFWTTWTILWWFASCFVTFLECRPLSTNWGVPTQCRPTFQDGVCVAVFNTISDIGVLVLPQPLIWHLQMPRLKKLGVSLVFLSGALYVIALERMFWLREGTDVLQCHIHQYRAHPLTERSSL